jgi:hypothetical protein
MFGDKFHGWNERRRRKERDVFFDDRSLHLYNMIQNILYIK